MNKKKLQALLVAGMLSVGIVGGTLAWFTAQDNVTNVFKTAASDNGEQGVNSGIEIDEIFGGEHIEHDKDIATLDKKVLPGDEIEKQVKVESTVEYNQFLRAKITKQWKDQNGEIVTHYKVEDGKYVYSNGAKEDGAEWNELNLDYIILNLAASGSDEGDDWTVLHEDGYYYYNQILVPEAKTSNLLNSVTLNSEAGNMYRDLQFDVRIDAESIQATNGAAADAGWCQDVPAAGIDGYTNKAE